MRFNLIGFLVGAVCALILYVVGTEIAQFRKEDLVFGLLALLLWALLTFSTVVPRGRGDRV